MIILMRLSRWLIAACAACLLALGFTGAAQAQSELVLREQIRVFSNLVTLGDLFENSGEASGAPVFRSPELGTKGVVAANRVAASARQHGLEWPNRGTIKKVVVNRPGRLITLDEVREAISKHAGGDEAWTVEFSRGSKPFHIDPRVKGPITIRHIDLQPQTGRFRASIGVDGNEHAVPEKTFTGRAYPSVEAIVPARIIQRGTTIVEDDLKRVRLPRSRVADTAIEDMETAIGMAARKRLIAGRPIRRTDIENPKLVKRNEMVTIVYKVRGMVLKSKGKALADASKGQVVPVMNIRSKRTIEAQTTGIGLVSVSSLEHSARPQKNRRAAGKSTGSPGGRNSYVIR